MQNLYKDLDRKMWITRCCRFNAHQRFEKHYNLASLSISLLTVYVISFNLFPFFDLFKKYLLSANDIGLFTIVLSIFILSISQYLSAKEFKLKATKFHDCGREIGILQSKLKYVSENDTSDEVKNLIEEIDESYCNLILRYEENHSHEDYEKFIIENPKEFPDTTFSIKFYHYYSDVRAYCFYYLIMISPPVAFLLSLSAQSTIK